MIRLVCCPTLKNVWDRFTYPLFCGDFRVCSCWGGAHNKAQYTVCCVSMPPVVRNVAYLSENRQLNFKR